MQLPSRFEKMRRNRRKADARQEEANLALAREAIRNGIDRIEEEITGHWQDELSEIGELNVHVVHREFKDYKPPQRRGWGWPFRSTKA